MEIRPRCAANVPEEAGGQARACVFDIGQLTAQSSCGVSRATPQLIVKWTTKRRFVTIHTDDELEAMLAAPLEKWRCFLHPSQERMVTRSFNGPARVLGGAGTGKTVVAMHRSRHLAAKLFTAPSDRVLVTTYTGNLAENIEAILKSLCGEEQSRIEVVHLHAFAVRLLRSHGVEGDIASPEEIEEHWQQAISISGAREFDSSFLRKECLAPASWCAGSAIKRPCEPVPVTYAPGGHRPDAKRRVHRSAARLPARPRPAPLVATNSSPGVCSVPTPPSRCISPPVCWRSITPPVAVAGSWGCTLAASPGTR